MDRVKAKEKVMNVLEEMTGSELLSVYREAYSCDGEFGFTDVFDDWDEIIEICFATLTQDTSSQRYMTIVPADDVKALVAQIMNNIDSFKNYDYIRFDNLGEVEGVTMDDLRAEMDLHVDELAEWLIDNYAYSSCSLSVSELDFLLDDEEEEVEE